MSSENNAPPAITPRSTAPRPDASSGHGYSGRTGAHADDRGSSVATERPVPPPPPPPASGNGSSTAPSVGTAPQPQHDEDDGMERAAGESRVSVARTGAVKAAAAAIAAAKTAAKKVGSAMPAAPPEHAVDDDPTVRRTPGATSAVGAGAASTMHYSAPGLSGTATGVSGTAQPATETTATARTDGPRRVRLALSRIDPWSAMKLGFLLAVAIGIMTVVATAVVWYVLDGMHVFIKIEDFVQQIVGTETDVNVRQYVAFGRVISLATLVGVVNVVIITALSTITAFLYNIVASLVGGVHLTLTDD
ncbi:DUF3566 domain-containing protein [Cellulosimicrobium arenosum]|nr:DUF3566 domain-containing protein [Cellulosimicrobium arenosum]